MGRHNHENSVAIPGYGHPVVLSGDDTFTAPRRSCTSTSAATRTRSGPTRARSGLRVDNAAINDYGDLSSRRPQMIAGDVQPQDRRGRPIAKATRPRSRTGRTRTTSSSSSGSRTSPTTAPTPNVVYFADTGEPRALPNRRPAGYARSGTAAARGRTGASGCSCSTRRPDERRRASRSWSTRDARGTTTLERNPPAGQHRDDGEQPPDHGGPGRESAVLRGRRPDATTARIWRYDISDRTQEVVAQVDQSAAAGRATPSRGNSAPGSRAGSSTPRASSGRLVPHRRPGGHARVDEEHARQHSPTSVRAASSACC